MNTDELIRNIYTEELRTLVVALGKLDESDRRALAVATKKECNKIIRLADTDWDMHDKVVDELKKRKVLFKSEELNFKTDLQIILDKSILSVLACCSSTDVKRLQFWRYNSSLDLVYVTLKERKPAWLKDWLEASLKQDYSGVDWPLVSYCIKNNLCEALDSDAYIETMTTGIWNTWGSKEGDSVYQVIRNNEWLFDNDIWRIFECDSWCFEKQGDKDSEQSWRYALVKYSEDRPEQRQRLLQSALDGLLINLKNPVHRGFIHFYQGFELSVIERKALESTYFSLLTSNKSFVVGFALGELEALQKNHELNSCEFLANAKLLLAGSVKSQQKKCLKICSKIIKENASQIPSYLSAIISGLVSENVDLQDSFLGILRKHIAELSNDQVQGIRDLESFISPSLNSAFKEIVGSIQADDEISKSVLPEQGARFERLQDQLSNYSDKQLALVGLSGLDESDSYSEGKVLGENLSWHKESLTSEIVQSYMSCEELIDAVSCALESCDTPETFEKILDGISRLHLNKDEHFAFLTDSIRSRIEKMPADKGICSLRQGLHELNRLILYWVAGHEKIGEDDWYSGRTFGFYSFMADRINEVLERVKLNIEAPLLSLPSYASGFIEPSELIKRLNVYLDGGLPIPHVDLQQAIVRLNVDSPTEATIANELDLSNIYHRLVAFSLGKDVAFDIDMTEYHPLWLCAVKVRCTAGSAITELREDGAEVQLNCFEPIEFSSKIKALSDEKFYQSNSSQETSLHLELQERTGLLEPIKKDLITSWVKRSNLQSSHTLWIRLLQISMPGDYGMLFHNGVKDTQALLDKDAIADIHLFTLYGPFMEGIRGITPIARKLIFLGLISKNFDTQSAAIESVITLVDDEKLIASSLVSIGIAITNEGLVKQARFAKALSDIATVSNRHKLWVKSFIEGYIENLDEWPKSFHQVMELLLEVCHQLEVSVTTKVNTKLETIKGSSKLAKIAKGLRSLNFSNISQDAEVALCEGIEIRLEQLNKLSLNGAFAS